MTSIETQTAMPQAGRGIVLGAPALILRAEGAALLAAVCTGYAVMGGSWLVFAVLFLAPDLFMLGYLTNTRIGAALYNFAHTTIVPFALIGLGLAMAAPVLTSVGLIWLGHVGFDRMVGYGLKYGDAFQHTHLGGRAAKE